ncbi:hypothetical protein Fcan01_19298 [Folsomia candida]|uniref:MULE transposase domain-containing protein n=1 Tax=Folsomia candida TaxID=158441 RepID=A0A226DLC9_FOLCA|nr:hypothetical protein Fcan01_19298 [Folsomia candida]
MILASITDLIQLLLNLLSTAIQPPIHLNTKSSPPFFATCQRLNRSTKFKLSILTGYGIFLILNGFWQVKKSSDVTVLASTLLRQVGSHNHEPKPIACDVKKVMTKIRQAASSSSIAPAQLIANEIRQMPAASQGHMPLAHNIKRGIRKVRGVTTGSLIVPSKREDIKLPDSFKITSNNENFLAFDSGSHADRIMIFSTARNLEFLSQCNVWLIDGTFKSSPVLFDQLFILHGMGKESTFPLIYCLTPNRTSGTYIRLLSEIKKLQPNLDPTTILGDYEKASIRAMEDIFPQAEKNGCFFHYSQCIFRNIQKHPDIHNLYSNDSNFSLMMKHLRSLAFVPPDDVVMSFDLLMEDEFFTTNEIMLAEFINYFERTWIGQWNRGRNVWLEPIFSIKLWNCFHAVLQGLPKTTNACEGFHHGFATLLAGTEATPGNKYKLLALKLQETVEKYGLDDFSHMEYLRKIAYCL